MGLASKGMTAKRFISFVAALGVGWFVLGSGFAQAATSSATPMPSATPTPSPIFGKCIMLENGSVFPIFYGCVAAGTVVGTNVPVSAVGVMFTSEDTMVADFTVNNNGTTTKFSLNDGKCTVVSPSGGFTVNFGTVTPTSGFADTFDAQFTSSLFPFDTKGDLQSTIHFAASSSTLVLVGTCN